MHIERGMRTFDFRADILPLKNKLFRLALRITSDRAEAEDIVQETMLRVWQRREELYEVENIEAFCTTICHRLSIDSQTRKGNHQETLDESYQEVLSSHPNPQEILEQQDKLAIVRQLFNQLPTAQRVVMHLRDVEGKSYREIAALVGQTEEQVKINLFRARQRIRGQMKDIENHGL